MARLLRPFGAVDGDGRTAFPLADEQELSPQASLRRVHERFVFRAISAHNVVSRTQLAALTGLSAQSVGRLVQILIDAGLVDSAHDCSEGGLAVTLAESTFGKGIGVSVNLKAQGLPPEFVLFGEDASRIVISCDRGNLARIQQVAAKHRLSADEIGETVPEQLEIRLDGEVAVSAPTSGLRDSYEGALEAALRTENEVTAAV